MNYFTNQEKIIVAESLEWVLDNLGEGWVEINKVEIPSETVTYSGFMEKIYGNTN